MEMTPSMVAMTTINGGKNNDNITGRSRNNGSWDGRDDSINGLNQNDEIEAAMVLTLNGGNNNDTMVESE